MRMRRYDEPVEVRRGPVPGWPGEGPAQLLWRGRLWKVRAVVAHWVETGPWWQHAHVHAVIGSEESGTEASTGGAGGSTALLEELLGEREVWRVEAGRGPGRPAPQGPQGSQEPHEPATPTTGVLELTHDTAEGRWQLVGCTD